MGVFAGILGFIIGVLVTVFFAVLALFGLLGLSVMSTAVETSEGWDSAVPAIEIEEGWDEEPADDGGALWTLADAA